MEAQKEKNSGMGRRDTSAMTSDLSRLTPADLLERALRRLANDFNDAADQPAPLPEPVQVMLLRMRDRCFKHAGEIGAEARDLRASEDWYSCGAMAAADAPNATAPGPSLSQPPAAVPPIPLLERKGMLDETAITSPAPQDSEALLPCPFCGAPSRRQKMYVTCDTPKCALNLVCMMPEQWNRRASTAAQAEGPDEAQKAYSYLSRLFKTLAPQCDKLTLLCTQIDNYIVGIRQDNTRLTAEVERLTRELDDARRGNGQGVEIVLRQRRELNEAEAALARAQKVVEAATIFEKSLGMGGIFSPERRALRDAIVLARAATAGAESKGGGT